MNLSFSERTEMLIGKSGVEKLAQKHVAVFGVGGVGGAVCEGLARTGVGAFTIFDNDIVAKSNINRQIIALESTIGQKKVHAMAQRIKDINPNCKVVCEDVFYLPENAENYPMGGYDFVVDAVDTVSAKIEIITRAQKAGVNVVSSMGAGNKLRPEMLEITTIEKTSVCPLARVMRKELKKRGIKNVRVVFSKEAPAVLLQNEAHPVQQAFGVAAKDELCARGEEAEPLTGAKKVTPASMAFVPLTAGFILASEVIRKLL